MRTLQLTPAQYLKAIDKGIIEPIKDISVYKKTATHFKLCGRTEEILINIKQE